MGLGPVQRVAISRKRSRRSRRRSRCRRIPSVSLSRAGAAAQRMGDSTRALDVLRTGQRHPAPRRNVLEHRHDPLRTGRLREGRGRLRRRAADPAVQRDHQPQPRRRIPPPRPERRCAARLSSRRSSRPRPKCRSARRMRERSRGWPSIRPRPATTRRRMRSLQQGAGTRAERRAGAAAGRLWFTRWPGGRAGAGCHRAGDRQWHSPRADCRRRRLCNASTVAAVCGVGLNPSRGETMSKKKRRRRRRSREAGAEEEGGEEGAAKPPGRAAARIAGALTQPSPASAPAAATIFVFKTGGQHRDPDLAAAAGMPVPGSIEWTVVNLTTAARCPMSNRPGRTAGPWGRPTRFAIKNGNARLQPDDAKEGRFKYNVTLRRLHRGSGSRVSRRN